MPEGHTIHRAALDQRPMLVDHTLHVWSPQGRFDAGAKLVDGVVCVKVEALGKHLLYHFENGLSLHIHLGLAGVIRRGRKAEIQARDATRVRFESASFAVDIRGPAICEILEPDEVRALRIRLGPDVLAAKAKPERAFEKIAKSKAAIGTLLMNQQVIAGIGNIYRVEVLWILGIDPRKRGCDLSRDQLQAIWKETRRLMKYGVKHDAIITKQRRSRSKARYNSSVNIYGGTECPRCDEKVTAEKMAARTVYFCKGCQK